MQEDRDELLDKLEKKNDDACKRFAKCEKEIKAGERTFDEYYCHCLVDVLETNFAGLREVYKDFDEYISYIEDYKKSIQPTDDDYTKKEAYAIWQRASKIKGAYTSLMNELQEDWLLAKRALKRYPELSRRGYDDIESIVEYLGARYDSYQETLMFIQEFEDKRIVPFEEFMKIWSNMKVAEDELRGRVFTEDDIQKD